MQPLAPPRAPILHNPYAQSAAGTDHDYDYGHAAPGGGYARY